MMVTNTIFKGHGGIVFHAKTCFIQPNCACAINVIRLAGIVGRVLHELVSAFTR